MMTLSIVSHGQAALVAALLADVERIGSPHVTSIVVTRNVVEGDIAIPPSLVARVTVVDNRTPSGFGANHNAAFARCTTPYFAVLNPDIRLVADPFEPIAARLTASTDEPRLALVAPRIVAPDGEVEDAARKLITPWRLLERRILARSRTAASDFDWLAGMFMVVRSDAFRALRGFDERYFLYCEDFDLCARLRLAGWRIALAEDVRVVHDAQRASHRSTRHLLWHVESLLRMWTSSAFWRYRRVLAESSR